MSATAAASEKGRAGQNGRVSTTDPAALTALHVAWDDPRAIALRDTMEVEMSARYADKAVGQSAEQRARVDAALNVDPAGVVDTIVLVDAEGLPVAHAALRDLRGELEMKRVVVLPGRRGLGIGARLMVELDESARRAGYARIILQTGDRQPDAVRLYERSGYTPIPVYEPYIDTIPFSICLEKRLA